MAQVPAHLAKYAARLGNASEFAVASRVRFPQISIGDNRFTAVDEEGNEINLGLKHFDFIVVAANPNTSKIFYASGFDAGKPSAPDCYSDNGVFPDIRVAQPRGNDCTNCPMNAWGSAKSQMSGKDIKACGDYKKLAVIPFDSEGQELPVHMFRLSPASNPNWAEYIKTLARTRITDEMGLNPQHVLNRAYWSDKKNVMAFEMVDFLQEGELDYIADLRDKGEFTGWIGTDDQSQARPQLAASPRHVHQAIEAPKRPEAVDAEFTEEPQTHGRRTTSREASSSRGRSVVEEAPRKPRAGGRTPSEFLDEQEAVPGRARAEALESGREQGTRLSAVDAAKARAREQIGNGAQRR